MENSIQKIARPGALLAINLLFLMVWGFTGIAKFMEGKPVWFADKFGKTFLATFPGLTVTFWMLAVGEVAAFLLAAAALIKLEFLDRKPTVVLQSMLVWSLFLFVQLGLGQWITNEFTGGQQLFMYFAGTLVALGYVQAKRV